MLTGNLGTTYYIRHLTQPITTSTQHQQASTRSQPINHLRTHRSKPHSVHSQPVKIPSLRTRQPLCPHRPLTQRPAARPARGRPTGRPRRPLGQRPWPLRGCGSGPGAGPLATRRAAPAAPQPSAAILTWEADDQDGSTSVAYFPGTIRVTRFVTHASGTSILSRSYLRSSRCNRLSS